MTERFIAYLATARAADVAAETLVAVMRNVAAPLPLDIRNVTQEPAGTASDAPIVLVVDGIALAIMFLPAPLPAEAYARALALNLTWPEAGAAMAGAQAHVVIGTVAAPASHGQAVNAAGAVTLAAAALAALLPAVALVWTTAHTITPPGRLTTLASGLGQRRLPLELWVGLQILRMPPASLGAPQLAMLTDGLLPFLGRELEWQPSPLPAALMAQRLLGICDYLLREGPVVRDGDTLGITPEERIRLRLATQGQRNGVPVMLLAEERI